MSRQNFTLGITPAPIELRKHPYVSRCECTVIIVSPDPHYSAGDGAGLDDLEPPDDRRNLACRQALRWQRRTIAMFRALALLVVGYAAYRMGREFIASVPSDFDPVPAPSATP